MLTIESIDVSGTSAAAKVILESSSHEFIDYLTLLKEKGQWQIIHNAPFVRPKS